ncbi:ABC-2 family transporter protein [Candidatus Dojkabacteria bacterium]|nr:ABC-2 family transporter protein [Candidatus Dojkabacteria bacterium]
MSLGNALEYRVNFYVWAFVNVVYFLAVLVFYKFFLGIADNITGWELQDLLILYGTYSIFFSIAGLTFLPMIYGFSDFVKNGKLQNCMHKPLDLLFQSSFRWMDFDDVYSLPLGLIIIIVTIINYDIKISVAAVLLYIFTFLCGLLILYSMVILVTSLAFFYTDISAVNPLVWEVIELSKYPSGIFKGIWKFVLTFIIPVGLMTVLPASLVVGLVENWWYVIISFVIAVILYVVSRTVFYRTVRRYEGVGI